MGGFRRPVPGLEVPSEKATPQAGEAGLPGGGSGRLSGAGGGEGCGGGGLGFGEFTPLRSPPWGVEKLGSVNMQPLNILIVAPGKR